MPTFHRVIAHYWPMQLIRASYFHLRSIVIDTDARYLYYVLADNKAVRYGVAVSEEALSWYGIAKTGRKQEWPSWTPTAEIKCRLGNIPDFMEGGPHNPDGRSRPLSLSGW
jgi:lipoprotein-anchoring transpeptidase ErfK/SrfK